MSVIPLNKENLLEYVRKNSIKVYADRDETISDDVAQKLLKGEFEAVDEFVDNVEVSLFDYADWETWKAELASAFGLENYEELPEYFQELIDDYKGLDTEDYWRDCFNNYRGKVVATLRKRNGEYIEFPCLTDLDDKENRKLARYLKEACGITGDSGALYAGTVLKVLGRVDFYEIWKKQEAPRGLVVSDGDFTIGHHSNGSGTACNDKYQAKPRFFNADFTIDGLDGYGVDQTFWFVDRVWNSQLQVAFKLGA